MSYNSGDEAVVDDLREFLQSYYPDEISQLAQRYPDEQRHITVDWGDLMRYDADLADDYLKCPSTEEPEKMDRLFTSAVRELDIPTGELTGVDVRVVGLHEADIYQPIEIDQQHPEGYLGVQGELKKVTQPSREISTAVYACGRCGTANEVPQTGEEEQKPHDCMACEREGPWELLINQSEFEDYCKIRIETPPDESGDLQSDHIDCYVRGELVWEGHEDYGLISETGKSATVYGRVSMKQKKGRGVNERLFDTHLLIDAIEFGTDEKEVDIKEHRETFTEFSQQENAVDLFAESLVPELYATPEWEAGLELLVAYLFGSPRIDVPQGPTYRGDIHVLIMSDYGMGKSMVNSAVAMYSPKCIKESVTGMSSDVGLLAAAVEDDGFGDGQWTLKPGILVRANGGHVILDEIDKTDADLERMNDALEGEQMVQVNKAGQRATYKSRIGLLATGNPKDSRFDKNQTVSEQLGLDQSLLSRFDGIVIMKDAEDEEQDGYIAEAQGMSYVEAQEYQYGDREELDNLSRVVEPDVGRAWIQYARENVNPLIRPEHIEQIREFYAEDVRQLNRKFADNSEEGADMPVPVNARVVANTIRAAVAFARVGLQETVTQQNVDRAIDLQRKLVGQTYNDGQFTPHEAKKSATPKTQDQKMSAIESALSKTDKKSTGEIAAECNLQPDNVSKLMDNLSRKGEVYQPDGEGKGWLKA